MKEPLWRTVLNWSAVITFFTLPLSAMIIHLYALTHPGWLSAPLSGEAQYDFSYLTNLQMNVTFLVFGLAGLRTWETIKTNGKYENSRPPRDHVGGLSKSTDADAAAPLTR